MHVFIAYFVFLPDSDTCGGGIMVVLVFVVKAVVILVTLVGELVSVVVMVAGVVSVTVFFFFFICGAL